MSENDTTSSTTRTTRTTGAWADKWPALGTRVNPEQRTAIQAEVDAAKARGESVTLQSQVGEIFDEWLLRRPALTDYARRLHAERDGQESAAPKS